MAVAENRERRDTPNPERPLRWPEVVQGGIAGLAIVLLVAVALIAYHGGGMAASQDAALPNVIIIIVADALRVDRLSCYGYTTNRTPHIDTLARDGVRYRHAHAPSSWTKPSVATILTSLYPSTHRAICFDDILPDEVLTLPEILSAYDYHTVGFVNNINLFPDLNFQQGYGKYYVLGADESSQNIGERKYYQEAELVNRHVLPWLENEHAKPGDTRFFMYIHYMDPHRPYFEHPYNGNVAGYNEPGDDPAPAEAPALSALYDGEVSYLDTHLGDVLAALKRLGLYDEALIVFTADHGEEFYEHQGWFHGKTLYEEVTAVPLIVKYPGNVRAGTVDEGLARSLDIAPTILDVSGIEPPAAMRGVSLRLPPDSPARAQLVFAEVFCMAGAMSVRTPRYKLIEVIDGDLRGRTPTQLYDLEIDPGETTNLAATRPDIVARLRADMGRTLNLAERAAVGGQKADLDAAFKERLRQLGY